MSQDKINYKPLEKVFAMSGIIKKMHHKVNLFTLSCILTNYNRHCKNFLKRFHS